MLSYLPVLSLLLALGGNHCKNDTDYCSLSCGRKKNVCCLNPPGEPGVNCRDGFRVIHMSNIDRHLIITHHNVLRNYVAAGKMGGIGMERARVSNMRALSYSRELEYTASCWAFKCSTSFSRCRRTAAHLVGENVCILVGKILEADRIARTMLKLCPMYFLSGKPNESADMLFDPGEDEYQQNLMAQQIVLASARWVPSQLTAHSSATATADTPRRLATTTTFHIFGEFAPGVRPTPIGWFRLYPCFDFIPFHLCNAKATV